MENYYSVLGVSRLASASEIKRAYRICAQQWHPDKRQNDPNAQKRFILIQQAYRTLTDPFKKSDYDSRIDAACKKDRVGYHQASGSRKFTKNGRYPQGLWQFVCVMCFFVGSLALTVFGKEEQYISVASQDITLQEADMRAHMETQKTLEHIQQVRIAIKAHQNEILSEPVSNSQKVKLTSEIYKETRGQQIKQLAAQHNTTGSTTEPIQANVSNPSPDELYSINMSSTSLLNESN